MGFRSLLLWGWRTDAACPEHCGRSDGHSMPSYGERLGGGAVCPLCRETASSEAEMSHPLEGRSATLERGGDVSRSRESRGEPSSGAEFVQRARGGCEWAARWISLNPFLSSGWEAGRGTLWAQLR